MYKNRAIKFTASFKTATIRGARFLQKTTLHKKQV
jgi:hypothetical protein